MRDHLKVIERTSGITPEELVPRPCPFEVAPIWDFFAALNLKRQSGMGVNPISSEEIESWARRMGITLSPFENMLIDRLDECYLRHQSKKEST